MAARTARRSISFQILDSHPGDGDSVDAVDDRAESSKGAKRRRRKSRAKKLSLGDLTSISGFEGDFYPLTPTPPAIGGSDPVPPPEVSLAALRTSSSPLPQPHLPNGDSKAESSSHSSVRSIDDSVAVASSLASSSRSSVHGATSRDQDGSSQSAPSHNEHRSQVAEVAKQKTALPSISSKGNLENAALGSLELILQPEEVLKPIRRLAPRVPDFSTASEGLASPPHIPGTLHPPSALRQRLVDKTSDSEGERGISGSGWSERRDRPPKPDSSTSLSTYTLATPPTGKMNLGTFPTPQMKDWELLMASNVNYPPPLELSPMQYLFSEVSSGSTLRNTTSVGTDQKRERVYNTMFHVPWRCELLIDVGFFVCLDAFLSLFTIMPLRIVLSTWQRLRDFAKGRPLQRLQSAELSDVGCLVVMIVGVTVLMQANVSILYHFIRGQGVVKLYVVFNVLEIFDKLGQSFGSDVIQVFFNSAESVECCKSGDLSRELARYVFDGCIAIFCFLMHSLVIICQAVTISAAVNAQNNALLTLLISNNFAEIKSNVFKRMGTDQLHKMAYLDTVERFHIMTHVLFVWAQNVLNTEDSIWTKFLYNAGMVYCCEVLVDVVKHSFLAKFNEVKPVAYSEFLQALCHQTLNSQSHEVHKTLTFVPLAPACVVMRILLPVYAAFIPDGPIWWRWPCMLLQGGLTYISLLLVKITVGLGLQNHAKWYLNRHPGALKHPHSE